MTVIAQRLRAVKERLAARRAERRASAPERAQRRAQAEALRLENRRRAYEDQYNEGRR
jgi:hypothetical protein